MNLKLIPVSADNWKRAVFLTTDPDRNIPLNEKWLTSNAFSLLQCHYDPDWDCRLMMDGEKPWDLCFMAIGVKKTVICCAGT